MPPRDRVTLRGCSFRQATGNRVLWFAPLKSCACKGDLKTTQKRANYAGRDYAGLWSLNPRGEADDRVRGDLKSI